MPCLLILLVVWPRLVGARQRLRPRHKSSAPCNPVWNQDVDAMRIARCVGTRQRLGSPARSGCRCACADKRESAAISTSAIIDVPCLARGWGLVSARAWIFLPCQPSGLVLFVLHDPVGLCRSPARGWDQALRWRMHGSFEHGHPVCKRTMEIARSSPLALSLHASRARQWLWNLQQTSHIQNSSSFSAKRQPTHRPTSSQWTAFWASSSHRSKACPPKWTGSASGMRSKIGFHFGILLRDHPPIIFCKGAVWWRARGCAPEAGDTSGQHLRRNGFGLS